mgnify:CR=1 FL=1
MIDQTCQHLQVDARLLSFMLHKMNASQDQFFLTVPASRSKFLTVSSRRALLGTVILLAVAFAATKSAAAGSAAFYVSAIRVIAERGQNRMALRSGVKLVLSACCKTR